MYCIILCNCGINHIYLGKDSTGLKEIGNLQYLPTVGWSCSVPYLLVSFTADSQHFFTLMLQLSGQSVNGLIERVDLVVQVSDAVVTGTHL